MINEEINNKIIESYEILKNSTSITWIDIMLIIDIIHKIPQAKVTISKNNCKIQFRNDSVDFTSFHYQSFGEIGFFKYNKITTTLEVVIEELIKFIQWYKKRWKC